MRIFTKSLLALALTIVCVGGAKANRFLFYNNGTAGSVDYDKQAICNFNAALVTNQQYIIKAKIKVENADGVSQIGFWLVDEPNNKTSYQAAITPTSEFVEYTWYFTPWNPSTSGNNDNLNPTRMIFNTGKFGGKVYIDDVTCKPNGGSTEFVDNGDFNLPDVSNWSANYQGPSYTIDSDFPNADFVMVYNNGTAGANDYDRQAICKFNSALTLGQQYVIKAKIKVENPNPDPEIKIGFNINDGVAYPDTKTSYGAAIVPTDEFVEYTWYYTPSDWNPAQFVFNTGKFGGKVYIDDVTCKPNVDNTELELVDNGNFNLPDVSNWSANYQGPSYTRWDYEVSATVGADGFATYSAVKPINVDGIVTAYGAKYDGSKIVLTPVTEIPANTGVIIEAAEGSYTVPAINSAAVLDNDLLVSNGSVTGNGTIYALGKKNSVVGFVKVAEGVTIPSGKAYLVIPTPPANALDFIGFADDVTGVNEVKVQKEVRGEYYNLNGQRVSQPTKGLYIVNGKKVIVK